MKLRLKILVLISFFVCLYAVYYWGIPAVINHNFNVENFQNSLKKEFGIQLKMSNPKIKMGLTPSVWFNADSFEIDGKKNTPLNVKNPKLKIKLLPLLLGKVNLAYFSCDKLNADLKIDKKYKIYVGDFLIVKSENSLLSIENSQMHIDGYELHLKDEIQNKTFYAKGDYFYLEKYNSKKKIKFSTNSVVKVDNNTSLINLDVDFNLPWKKGIDSNEVVFDGVVTNFNLAYLSPYVKKFTKGKIQKTTGIINIQADTRMSKFVQKQIKSDVVLENLSFVGKDKVSSVYFKDRMIVKSVCTFAKNILDINSLNINSGNLHLAVSGQLYKVSSFHPILNLTLNLKKSRVEDLVALLPPKNIANIDINIPALKKYGFYADVDGGLNIKGISSKPNIYGSLFLKNAYVVKPLNIPKASVKLIFKGQKLAIDVLVPSSVKERVSVKGLLDLYSSKNISLDISSSQNVDLKIIEAILNPAHEIFNFDLGPLPAMKLSGVGNIKLKTFGSKTDSHLIGALNFNNVQGSFNGLSAILKDASGTLFFKDKDTHFQTKKAFINNKSVSINGDCTLNGDINYIITANGQTLNNMLLLIKNSPMLSSMKDIVPVVKASSGLINFSIKLHGKAKSVNEFKIGESINVSGNIKLLGNNVIVSNLYIPIRNLFGNIRFNNRDADFNLYSAMEKSKLKIDGKVKNGELFTKIKLDDLFFMYSNIPVKVYSGYISISKNNLTFQKVNAMLDTMPILVDGVVSNLTGNPKFNLYFNSKPSQRFMDKYINKNSIYPLKYKGDVLLAARINGTEDSFNVKSEINLDSGASLYYMGATIGDANDPLRLFIDANVNGNLVNVKNFQYDKLISSQNDKEFISSQLAASGQLILEPDEVYFRHFRVRTQNPTDAKIFNLIFKKPMIKHGLFNSNLFINGAVSSPKMLGYLNFTGLNLPVVDTTIKDISMNFNNNSIDIESSGELFSNKYTLSANMDNKLTPPYVFNYADVKLGNLDVNEIVKSLNDLEFESNSNVTSEQPNHLDLSNIIIKKAKVFADSVFVRNIFASNLSADFSLNEKMVFAMKNFKFDAAQGSVKGDFKYNLLNSRVDLDLDFDSVNANSFSELLFNLQNQLFGTLTGSVNLTCNGKTNKSCMNTLTGGGGFSVANGRMPKLGSLEYLLKASNLLKGGITGLTLNGLIDLVSPLRTGQFDSINGRFSINSGIADDIQIFSKGKNLSLFITGTYNFPTLIANLDVFGRLSKKITNILGPVGNTSLNTLFNTIPGLNLEDPENKDFIKNLNKIPGFELNDKAYRVFSVKVYGDINGENYVQSFKWVE